MMYKRTILVWLLLIIGIKSQPLGDFSGGWESQPSEYYSELQEPLLKGPFVQEPLLEGPFDGEPHLFDIVLSYYQPNDEQSSWWNRSSHSTVVLGVPNDRQAFALVYTTFFMYRMAVILKSYSVFNSCIVFENEPVESIKELDFYVEEITFAFDTLKKEIKKYVDSIETGQGSTSSSASREYRRELLNKKDIKFGVAVRQILDLNSGFLSSKKTLNKKELLKYVNETIQWTSMYDYNVIKKSDKIFPPCPFIREQLHCRLAVEEKNFIKEKVLAPYLLLLPIPYGVIKTDGYIDSNKWTEIIANVHHVYKTEVPENLFYLYRELMNVFVIDVEKTRDIRNCLKNRVLLDNNYCGSVKAFFLKKDDFLPRSLKIVSNLWSIVKKENNFINYEKTEKTTANRIRYVIELLRSIEEVKMVF